MQKVYVARPAHRARTRSISEYFVQDYQVLKLQDERAINAYLFKSGFDDQDPQDWDDVDTSHAEGLGHFSISCSLL